MSGASLGPTIAGIIYDATQSYRTAFTLFAATSLVAVFVIYFAKPPFTDESEFADAKI
jgi:cyanate permease